ncbi:MAG TPA: hypothetical protein VK645_03115 [Chitinophagaceae bacterium]|nr:hypothetical protein [Chitinophagaceae bacterium]
MQTLYNIVTYNHQHYPALTEEKDRKVVEKLIAKLQHLENEILPVTAGTINISPTGNMFIHNYPPALHRKINLV